MRRGVLYPSPFRQHPQWGDRPACSAAYACTATLIPVLPLLHGCPRLLCVEDVGEGDEGSVVCSSACGAVQLTLSS